MKNLILPPIVPYKVAATFENGWTDQYGAIGVAAAYSNTILKEPFSIKGSWVHGCAAPWTKCLPNLLVCNNINLKTEDVFVGRKDSEFILRQAGYKKAQSIGLPILYTNNSKTDRMPRSLLVMPTHTLEGNQFTDRGNFEAYADEIQCAAVGFDRVVICVHPSCHKNGLWTNEFRARGFEIIFGALNYDRNALIRMRTLFEQFETVTTNGWGSHIAYALAFGSKVSVYGTQPRRRREDYLRDATWSADPVALNLILSEEMANREREYLEPFYRPPIEAVADFERGQWLIGADCKISPDAMKDVLHKLVVESLLEAPKASAQKNNTIFQVKKDIQINEKYLTIYLNKINSETTLQERFFLYKYFHKIWDGASNVVEIGPFLGGTTRAIALGMESNPKRMPGFYLDTLDRFDIYYSEEELGRVLSDLISSGELVKEEASNLMGVREFMDLFHAIHSRYSYHSLLRVHKSSLPDMPADNSDAMDFIPRENIGCAFIDGCKSWYSTAWFMKRLLPRMNKRGTVIFQDFGWFTCFWISSYAFAARKYFKFIHNIESTYSFQINNLEKNDSIYFSDFPAEMGRGFFEESREFWKSQSIKRSDLRGEMIADLHYVAALCVLGCYDEAWGILCKIRVDRFPRSFAYMVELAKKSPTYLPGKGPVNWPNSNSKYSAKSPPLFSSASPSASTRENNLRETLTSKNSNCNVSGNKILIFSDDPGQGGVAHHGHSLITALLKARAKVISAQPEMQSPLLDEQRSLGAEIIWTGYNPSKEFLRSAEDEADAERIMVSAQPDLIIFNDSCVMSHIAAKNVAIQNLLPFISICNTDTEYLALRFPKLMPAVEKHFCFAQQVVAVSESVLTTLRRTFTLPSDKGIVVYYGRPQRFFETSGASVRPKLRKELGVPEDAVLCLTTARMVADKGYQFQIEAIKKLKASGRLGNLYFAWAGDGELRAKFVELVKNVGLQDRVKVLGYRWDVDNLMSASDIFVLPSLVEAMPLSIMEAMAKGMPVIASAIAGVPEELGSTGCLLPDPNQEPQQAISKLAETLSTWASDLSLIKKLGSESHERAKLFFREEVMASRMVPLIASATACKNRELAVRKANLMSRTAEMTHVFEKYRRSIECGSSDQEGKELAGFDADEIDAFEQIIKSFQAEPSNASSRSQLADLRKGISDYLLGVQPSDLKSLMGGSYGKVFELIFNSGLQDEALISEESNFADSLVGGFDGEGQFDVRRLMASMLFWRAHRTAALLAVELIPSWFFESYINYLIFSPEAFQEIGEAELYRKHIHNVLSEFWRRIEESPRSPLSLKLSQIVASRLNLIPLYFNEQGNKDTYILRSKFIGHFLESRGLKLAETGQKTSSARKRIKVGFLNAHFTSQTETYTTIPTFSHLDRSKFEVILYCLGSSGGPLENFCRNCADSFVVLPQALDEQIKKIRGDKLDALVIGTNVTAVTNQAALLASARLAPVQLINNSSPVTSGMPHVDGYLSGTFLVDEKSGEEYSEKLCLLDGPSHCFNYEVDRREPVVKLERAGLGIPQDVVVYFSGANCFKIIPEMQEAWARILAKVPGSVLLLHPFNPNWASKYPVLRFERNMLAAFARHGVEANRLVLSRERLPSRSDVLELIKLSDIYLDSFPFAGVNSAVDPLEVGIPLVACEMQTFRSRMAGSLLRELKIEELIASREQDYIDLAIKLGLDSAYRSEVSQKIVSTMGANPRFLDSAAYSENMGRIIESLVGRSVPAAMPKNGDFTMQDAQMAFDEGRLSDAEDICREILGKDERCAGAWHLMGRMAALQGDIETAAEFASVACELDPQNAEFVRELAEVFLRKKELESAEQQVRQALEMVPDSPEGLVLLGRILAEKDNKSASLEAFQDALRLRKDYAEGFSQYATALQKFGRGKDAISQIRKACALESDSVEFQTNLAILLEQNARYVDALAAYGKAARMNPNVGFVWFRQGKLLNGLKRYAEAIPALEKAISLPGQLGDYYYEYGLALHMSKRFQEALVHYEKALSMGYNTAALQCNRGVIYKDLRKGGDAIMAFHSAVTMDPSNVSYLNNLGAAALELGLNSEALECFEQAVEKNPKLPTARNNIGNLLKDRARGMDALPQYRKSMELNPDDRDAPSNYLLCHMYIPDIDPKLVFEEHKKWGISTAKKFPPAFKFKPREAGAKIRVGFLSADLCHHPVAHFIEPIFRGYDRERFEFVAYGDQRKSDEFSARFAKQVDLWRETSSYDDRALAKLIHEDRVDILLELAGHTAYNRLGVFALKPAPVQVSYLGYPGTTGLPTIDFRITDAFADPQGTTEHLHTEKLIRVPECAWCFEPDASAPEVEPLPALKNGFVTFGCFNNMAKLNPALFETWAEILLRVPGSHLRLKARTLTDDGVRKELKSYFTDRGIEEDRLDFFGHTKKIADHLNHYHSVDIALDSFPYHGTTTTCEAMWMGCPVVTRAGKTHVSRVGVSLLTAVGLQEFITDTREAYIEKAVALAAQTDRLQELRAGMRGRLRQSVLMDEKRFVQGFEKALMEMANLGGLMRA